jgi:hypothetical protein
MKIRLFQRTILAGAAAIAAPLVVLSAGCVAVIGNTDAARKTTVGQELIDLKKALDAGVLTEGEYEKQKAKLLGGKK